MRKDRTSKRVEWKTVSIPRRLAEDIQEIIDEWGYWPSLGAFMREAALEKLRRERQSPGRVVEEPIVAFSREELKT